MERSEKPSNTLVTLTLLIPKDIDKKLSEIGHHEAYLEYYTENVPGIAELVNKLHYIPNSEVAKLMIAEGMAAFDAAVKAQEESESRIVKPNSGLLVPEDYAE